MSNTCNITLEVILPGNLLSKPEDEGRDVEIFIEFTMENSGIGAYEFWGQRCYDHGENYAVVDDWHLQPEEWMTPEIINYINDYIENNMENVEDKLNRIVDKHDW